MDTTKEISEFERQKLMGTALALAGLTILYNLAEGIVSVLWGLEDDSLTLFGFGIDSFIELASGFGILLMVIRLLKNKETSRAAGEKLALKITGYAFFTLASVLPLIAVYNAVTNKFPVTTAPGILVSCVSISVMWYMIKEKERVGKALGSDAIIADARCARVCIYMSVVLLAGSFAYMVFKIPMIDAYGSMGIAWFSYKEGEEAFEKAENNSHCGCHTETPVLPETSQDKTDYL